MSPETKNRPSLEEMGIKQTKIEPPEKAGEVLEPTKEENEEMKERDLETLREFQTTEDEKLNSVDLKKPKLRKLRRALTIGITTGVILMSSIEMGLAQEKKQEKSPELQKIELQIKELEQKADSLKQAEREKKIREELKVLGEKYNVKLEDYLVGHRECSRLKVLREGKEVGIIRSDSNGGWNFNWSGSGDEREFKLKELLKNKGLIEKEKETKNKEIKDLGFKLEISPEVQQIMDRFKIRLEGQILYLDLDPTNELINLNDDGTTKEILITGAGGSILTINCEDKNGDKTIVTIINGNIASVSKFEK